MFRALLCPSSGYKYVKTVLRLHAELPGCAACGREELCDGSCAQCEGCSSTVVQESSRKKYILNIVASVGFTRYIDLSFMFVSVNMVTIFTVDHYCLYWDSPSLMGRPVWLFLYGFCYFFHAIAVTVLLIKIVTLFFCTVYGSLYINGTIGVM
jgi:hypothetical protein